jgi:hypothetical protein
MNLQMLSQIGNPMGEKTDLDFRGTRVRVVLLVFFNEIFFGFC